MKNWGLVRQKAGFCVRGWLLDWIA